MNELRELLNKVPDSYFDFVEGADLLCESSSPSKIKRGNTVFGRGYVS